MALAWFPARSEGLDLSDFCKSGFGSQAAGRQVTGMLALDRVAILKDAIPR